MRTALVILCFIAASFSAKAQYKFSGHIDTKKWHDNVYLSIIEDYRKISGVYSEQIIARAKTDSLGYFEFTGNQLENVNRIYRLHVDNCFDDDQNQNHFDGHCDDSEEVIFIAKNKDTLVFPFSFDKQIFCDINSTNEKSMVFVKIDSLRENMRYAFAEYRSEANRKLNNKKWFQTLQDYGKSLDEPIAELYIYSFLSNRGNDLHEHYIEDLKTNDYYEDLLKRLQERYPNSSYTKQYQAELKSDEYIISGGEEKSSFTWMYILIPIFIFSLLFNIYFGLKLKKSRAKTLETSKEQLTKQEQNILELLLEEKSNKEIADALFVSLSTVKTHLNNIYKKLNVQSRDEVKSLFNS